MVVDATKRPTDGSSPNVKSFLTFIYQTSSESLQQKFTEIISFLSETHSSYAAKIAAHFGRDRREFDYALKKLAEHKIVKYNQIRSSSYSLALNPDVKKYVKNLKENNVKKSVGGVSDSPKTAKSSFSGSLRNVKDKSKNISKINLPYRLHRHTAYFTYVKKADFQMSKRILKNNRYQETIQILSGDYDVEYTKNYVIIRAPEKLASLNDYQLLRDELLLELAKVREVIERRYPLQLQLDDIATDTNNKFEIAAQDSFNQRFAKPYITRGINVHETDFAIDASKGTPEVDHIENWSMGEGVRKYQAMLDLSDNVLPIVSETHQQLVQLSEVQEEQGRETAVILKEISAAMKENSEIQRETAFTLKDIRSEVQHYFESLRAEIQLQVNQTAVRVPAANQYRSDSFQSIILKKLNEKDYEIQTLCTVLGKTYSKVYYHLQKLLDFNKITVHEQERKGRGAKKKIYTLGVKENYGE